MILIPGDLVDAVEYDVTVDVIRICVDGVDRFVFALQVLIDKPPHELIGSVR